MHLGLDLGVLVVGLTIKSGEPDTRPNPLIVDRFLPGLINLLTDTGIPATRITWVQVGSRN